jgi:hypothetical protein
LKLFQCFTQIKVPIEQQIYEWEKEKKKRKKKAFYNAIRLGPWWHHHNSQTVRPREVPLKAGVTISIKQYQGTAE